MNFQKLDTFHYNGKFSSCKLVEDKKLIVKRTIDKEEAARHKQLNEGSGDGSVGKAVASDTRDPRFDSRHQQSFY